MGLFDRLFGKKQPGDTWRLAQGEDEGCALIFRIRESAPQFATKAAFPNLLAVTWKYESPNEHGMPAQADLEQMEQLEDLLVPAFENARQAFLSVVATGNDVREWQFYAGDKASVMNAVNKALGHLDPFPVEFVFQEDPDWQGYSRFLAIGS
jgi:hypothetical protein